MELIDPQYKAKVLARLKERLDPKSLGIVSQTLDDIVKEIQSSNEGVIRELSQDPRYSHAVMGVF